MQNAKNVLKRFDFFSEQVTFFLSKRKRFSTVSGSILSILMLLSLLLFSYNELYAVIYRTKINVQMSESVSFQSQKISLNNSFALHIEPTIFNALTGKRYFDIQFILGNYFIDEDGIYRTQKTLYNASICNERHFPMFTKQQTEEYRINNWLCPDFEGPCSILTFQERMESGSTSLSR